MFTLHFIFSLSGLDLNLDFASIYERRHAVRGSSSWWSGYLISFCRSIVIIAAVYLFFIKKNKISLLILIACPIVIFSYDGTKSALLIPVFLSIIFFLVNNNKGLNSLLILMLFLITASIIEFDLMDTNIISTLFVRRIFAVPGLLNSLFWEYFSVHDKVMMADSIGRFFLDQSDVTASTYVIGYEYFNRPETNANTGIWMGGYAHFGFIGIILTSAIAGFILGIIDNLTKERFLMLGFIVCSYTGILWAEQMLHTSMLTGGIIYIVIFLMLYCNPSPSRHRKAFPLSGLVQRI